MDTPVQLTIQDFAAVTPQEVTALLDRSGVVLLRGAAPDVAAFEALSREICAKFHDVGVRQALRQEAGDGYTTEVFRGNFALLGHSEGGYRPWPPPPEACFFLCVQPPAAAGGETTLIDGHRMLQALEDEVRAQLEQATLTYECLWEPARWRVEFGVQGEDELRELLDGVDGCRYALARGMLHLFNDTTAITSSRSGLPVFANGVLAHLPHIPHPRYAGRPVYCKPSNRVHLDGQPLSDELVCSLIDAHDAVRSAHSWQAGDLLVIDNTRYMHGRETTAQDCERVIVSRFGRLAPPTA